MWRSAADDECIFRWSIFFLIAWILYTIVEFCLYSIGCVRNWCDDRKNKPPQLQVRHLVISNFMQPQRRIGCRRVQPLLSQRGTCKLLLLISPRPARFCSVSITWLVVRNLLPAIKLAMIASSLDRADGKFTGGDGQSGVPAPSKSNSVLISDWHCDQ